MRSKVRLVPNKFHHSKSSGPTRNTARLYDPEFRTQLALEWKPATETAEERWNFLRDTIHSRALSTFCKKEQQNSDWFDESFLEMEPVINSKREAFVNELKGES